MKKGIFVVLVVMIIVIAVLSGCSLTKKKSPQVTSSSSLVKKSRSKVSSNQSSSSVAETSITSSSVPQNVVKQSPAPIMQHKEAINKVIPKKVRKVPAKKSQDKKINIKSNEEAARYLKHQLGYDDPNIIAGGMKEYEGNDENGHYYTISLVYLPYRLEGKTGTMGIYYVYQDGKYKKVAQ